jgi:alkanesulfonate monooxygenase SsuD/methylene tetrahydromethanopterin reductase-like flavin-dependent oxidoreductase (luciferase family)
MRVGAVVFTFNFEDWARVLAQDWSRPPATSDAELVRQSLRLGDLIEPLGFDSLWSGEHFGTPYALTPNSMQHLAYWAGRTERVDVGTCVIVLPWWHPVRLAHEMAMLDILLEGRRFYVGLGRGLADTEFKALNTSREDSRARYQETLDILRLGLTQERFSYEGQLYRIPETSVRPQPLHADLMDRVGVAFVTPESRDIAARSGFEMLVVTSMGVDATASDVGAFNAIRSQQGLPPTQPTMLLWTYCAESEAEVEDGWRFFNRYQMEAGLHYGSGDLSRFQGVEGYEGYTSQFDAVTGSTGGSESVSVFGKPQLIGTPDEIIRRVQAIQELTSVKEIVVGGWGFGGMPFDVGERSLRLFAKEVLPVIQAMPTPIHPCSLGVAAADLASS